MSGTATIIEGDSLDLLAADPWYVDLVVTDPPYAMSGRGDEHALTATVAVVLRESAARLSPGGWLVVFSASSWRAMSYMVEAVRGVVEPVRVGTWAKPESRTRVTAAGWRWASVAVIAFRRGKSRELAASPLLDHIVCPPVTRGRRAELPPEVARWAVAPFAVAGGRFLDPFAGAGTLVHAAAELGMLATGFEKAPPPQPRHDG